MALFSKLGNILRQTANKQINNELRSSTPSIFQAIRCMSSSKLFIGGIAYQTDEQSLREVFSKYGEVVDARIIVDRDTGRSRGFGFITYTTSEEASSALQALDGQDLHGRRVRVNYATDKRATFGGGGGDGYGGGYGGGGGGYGGGGGGYGGGGYGGGGGGYGREPYSGGGGGYNSAGNYGGGGDGFSSGGNFSSNYGGGGNASGNYDGGNEVGYSSGNLANTSESGGFGGSGNFGTGGFDGNVTGGVDGNVGTGFGGSGSFGTGGFDENVTGGVDGNVGTGFGGGDQFASNESAGIGGGVGDNNQDDSLDGNYRDDDDNSNYAKRA